MGTTGARVGERLRAIRRQKGLSLHDVEARSNLEFKASVLGAYERGERAISVPRLLRLAEIYEVPADQLLPRELEGEISLVDAGRHRLDIEAGFTIDLVRLHDARRPRRADPLAVRDVDPARAPGLQRPDAHDPPLRPARARVVHGPQHRRARRPARAARPARRRRLSASADIGPIRLGDLALP